MPLYEYQCQECGEVHEVVRRFSDPPYTICASCGGALKKLISAPAIQFKGSGFYITDYGKGGSSKANESAGKSEGNSDGSSKSEGASSRSEGSSSKGEGSSKGESSSSKSEGSSSKTESSSKSEGSSPRSDRAPAGTKV